MNDRPGQENDNTSAYAALLAVQFLFGTLPVIGKVVLAVIPSVALVGFRVGATAVVLYAFQRSRSTLRLAERSDYLKMAALSFFGVTLNQLFFVGGLALTKAANTSLLAVTIPVFTLLIGAVIGTEKVTRIKIAGIILAAAGVTVLIDPRNASFSSETTLGDIMIIINSFAYGIYVATSKGVVMRNGALRSVTWIFIFASMICVPLGLFSISSIDLTAVGTHIWLLLLYIAVAATAAPYLLNAWALARVSPATVAVFVYLQPLIGFIAAALFLGEEIGLKFASSAVLVFIGIYFVMYRPRRGKRSEI